MPAPETLVQPIILLIDKDAPPSHADAVKAVAAGSDTLAEDTISKGDRPGRDVWGGSLSGPFTKTVGRANPKQ